MPSFQSRDSQHALSIAHITDLHARTSIPVTPEEPTGVREALDVLPKALALLKKQNIDLLVLTGDLIDVPTPPLGVPSATDADPQTLHAVHQDYTRLKKILDNGGIPDTVIAGNHDYEPIMWDYFERTPYAFDTAQGYRVVRFHDREDSDHSLHRLHREQALWETMLKDPKSPLQIHLQHYVIVPELDEAYPYNYENSETLKKEMADSGNVLLALSGHYHVGSELIQEGDCFFAVGPAFYKPPHAFRIYRIEGEAVHMEAVSLA